MKNALKIILSVLIGLSLMAADNPSCDRAKGRTPPCTNGCHDPLPVNPPHSKQPRDKKIRVTFHALIGVPERPTHIIVMVGARKTYDRDYHDQSFKRIEYAAPGQLVSITVQNTKIGGEIVGGYTLCALTAGREPAREIDRMELHGPGACHAEGEVRDSDG